MAGPWSPTVGTLSGVMRSDLSTSIFSTFFARGQQAVDVLNIAHFVRNALTRLRTRSINSTPFGRWQQRCSLWLPARSKLLLVLLQQQQLMVMMMMMIMTAAGDWGNDARTRWRQGVGDVIRCLLQSWRLHVEVRRRLQRQQEGPCMYFPRVYNWFSVLAIAAPLAIIEQKQKTQTCDFYTIGLNWLRQMHVLKSQIYLVEYSKAVNIRSWFFCPEYFLPTAST